VHTTARYGDQSQKGTDPFCFYKYFVINSVEKNGAERNINKNDGDILFIPPV